MSRQALRIDLWPARYGILVILSIELADGLDKAETATRGPHLVGAHMQKSNDDVVKPWAVGCYER